MTNILNENCIYIEPFPNPVLLYNIKNKKLKKHIKLYLVNSRDEW